MDNLKNLKSWKKFNEEFNFINKFRVYKKSKDFYRIEEWNGFSWKEIETDRNISDLLLINCSFRVIEDGRLETIGGNFKSSVDVPVHAWIECNDYRLDEKLDNPDGILYYNPFTTKKFIDRGNYEMGISEVIVSAERVGISGNFLTYKNSESYISKGTLVSKAVLENCEISKLFYL
jgi:hypothetical protein